jgi:hypothetical protein
VVLAGALGGLAAARVDGDDLAAAALDLLEPPLHVRRGHQAAVGDQRVAAQDEQVLRAIDVRDRDGQAAAEHEGGAHHLGQLVGRAGAVALAGAERADQHRRVQHGIEAVGRRVAEVDGHRVVAVALAHVEQAVDRLAQRLVPRHLDEVAAGPAQRPAQAVAVLGQRLEAVRLGTDVAARERIVDVAADTVDAAAVVDIDGDAAGRLAEGTGREVAWHRASIAQRMTAPRSREPGAVCLHLLTLGLPAGLWCPRGNEAAARDELSGVVCVVGAGAVRDRRGLP